VLLKNAFHEFGVLKRDEQVDAIKATEQLWPLASECFQVVDLDVNKTAGLLAFLCVLKTDFAPVPDGAWVTVKNTAEAGQGEVTDAWIDRVAQCRELALDGIDAA